MLQPPHAMVWQPACHSLGLTQTRKPSPLKWTSLKEVYGRRDLTARFLSGSTCKPVGNLALVDVGAEPALLHHPRKLASWREALGYTCDVQPPVQSAAFDTEPPQIDSATILLGPAADSAPLPTSWPLSNARSFVFKCWPRTSDGACSTVHLG